MLACFMMTLICHTGVLLTSFVLFVPEVNEPCLAEECLSLLKSYFTFVPLPGLPCTVQHHVTASTSVRCWWSRGPPFSPQLLVTSKQRRTNVKKRRRAIHSVLSSSMVGRYRQTGGESIKVTLVYSSI